MSDFGFFDAVKTEGGKSVIVKIAFTFLTLFGVWGFGDYDPPHFFKWITSELNIVKYFFQWLFMFILAYQGLGSQDLVVSLVASLLFYFIFEIVKFIERKFWKSAAIAAASKESK